MLVGLAALTGYVRLPVDAQQAVYPLFALGAGLVALVGSLLDRPRSLSRPLVGTGLLIAGLGDLATSFLGVGRAQPWSLTVADMAALVGLSVVTAGVTLDGLRQGGFRVASVIDGVIVALALFLLAWVAGLHRLMDVTGSWLTTAAAVVDPGVALLLAYLALTSLVSAGHPRAGQVWLLAGATAWLLADALLIAGAIAQHFASPGLTDIARAAGYLLLAGAAIKPSLGVRNPQQVTRFERLSSPVRLALFIAPALLPTILLWVPGVTDDRDTLLGLQLGGLGLTALVELRLVLMLIHANQSISERRRLEGELRNAAERDPLVGLLNRRTFRERLETAALGTPVAGSAAALFIDLDDFKAVNDSLGHAAGDFALVEVARRIERALRPNDVAARLGGDEFAAFLPGCESAQAARAVAERILRVFEEPIYAGGREVRLGASIGIALTGDTADAEALMRNADLAMYIAKQRGKGRIAVVESGPGGTAL